MKCGFKSVVLHTIFQGFDALTIHLQHFPQQISLYSVKH